MEAASTVGAADLEQNADKRLWIGNLDQRVTEYQLLKLVQKYGPIEKFDVLFHRSGPLAGQPRGYGFVTYVNEKDAQQAKTKLHNMLLGQKKICVTWAHSIKEEEYEKPKDELNIPVLAMSKKDQKAADDKLKKIQAIEAKLKLMETKSGEEIQINDSVASKSSMVAQFQQNKNQTNLKILPTKKYEKNCKPYGHRQKK